MIEEIQGCRQCGLCKNQKPLLQRVSNRPEVFFTGLSAVASTEVGDEPFSASTRSGQLMREIGEGFDCYYTNLVKCLPLKDGKLRYPTEKELEVCFGNFELELQSLGPRKVVLLGKQVSDFVAGRLGLRFKGAKVGDLEFQTARLGGTEYLSAYHPSYVLIYRRRQLEEYKSSIFSFITSNRAGYLNRCERLRVSHQAK
jgi:uracil-DNA glycosylase